MLKLKTLKISNNRMQHPPADITATTKHGSNILMLPDISTAITAAEIVCVTPAAKATAPTKAYPGINTEYV